MRRANPSGPGKRLVRQAAGSVTAKATESPMKRVLVRYKTKPESADENQRLVERVFDQLRAVAPEGVRYLALRLDDCTFVHFFAAEDGAGIALPDLEAFRSFQAGIRERCVDHPRSEGAMIVGNYRMLGD